MSSHDNKWCSHTTGYHSIEKVWWWFTWQPDPILQKPQISYQVIIETLDFGISLYLLLIHRPWPFWDLPNNNDTKSSYENLLPWMILEWFAVALMKKKNINCCFNEKMNFWISDVLSNYLRKEITYGRIIAEELMQMQNFNFRCWHDIILFESRKHIVHKFWTTPFLHKWNS